MTATGDLRRAGVSIWLDDLSRGDLVSGRLAELIRDRDVTGVTTNPTIFAKAVEDDPDAYASRLAELRASGAAPREAALALVAADVREACDVLRPVFDAAGGADGFVSIEVTPDAAHDTAATLAEVRELRGLVDRPNVLVKIPSTDAGVRALEEATAEGASINMTLLFGLERYGQVMAAYRAGLARAAAGGIPLDGIHSVASFFVSRVDVAVDERLAAIGGPVADGLRGLAAVANARLAYAAFEESLMLPEWQALAAAGAHPQRPLWASTGVKDPAMRDTRYLEELVAPEVVDTIPAKTLEALYDHGAVRPDTVRGAYAESRAVLDDLERAGVRLADVTAELERAGIDAFGASWARLVAAVVG
ncbi:transaldolase [Leifsonia shinshuensis]|uniref:Transaldolase n=1 Tax=Leifsonia shinshuensis TaxID=150026 RepID=A0A7G6Y5K0_9MICO|nr:transaldolase [Leifsonia shinshuensis]QNE33765.1 transaldolase [Leifsonia shinshuensis]